MQYIWMFLFGVLVGVVAKFLMPGKDPGGFIVTGLLGVAGMFLGGRLSSVLFGTHISATGSIEPAGFIGGVIGSIILLIIYRLVRRKAS